MPLGNVVVVAAAGSGKTTSAVRAACSDKELRTALVTYTVNGQDELKAKAYGAYGCIPNNVTITTWYSFVLSQLIRPYQNHLYDPRIASINFERAGPARRRFSKTQTPFYLSSRNRLWSDRATDFASQLIDKTGGLPIMRLEAMFDRIVIDEAQDLAGWDLEIIQQLLKSSIEIWLVGDHRQATFATNDNPKNKKYRGESIIDKFREWEGDGLVKLSFQCVSRRCIEPICKFADQFYPDLPPTEALNKDSTAHDGVFLIKVKEAQRYFDTFKPQTLQWSNAGQGRIGQPINFGAVKGMTFERVMIYPHTKLVSYLKTGNMNLEGESKTKSYVAITRAKHSVGIVVPDNFVSPVCEFYEFDPAP